MKRFFVFLFFCLVMMCYQEIIPFNKEILSSIVFSFIPSLLPCLVIVNLVIEMDSLVFFYNKLKGSCFGRFIYTFILVFVSVSLGMPSLQLLLDDHCRKGIISRRSYNCFVYSFGTLSFPFLYGVCVYNMNSSMSFVVLFIHYLVNCFCLFCCGFSINNVSCGYSDKSFFDCLSMSFRSSLKTIGIIVCSVMFFSLFLFCFECIGVPFRWFVEGLFEFSYPCLKASQKSGVVACCIVLFISLFPSLSIIVQGKIINRNLNIVLYIFIRLLVSLLGVFLYVLLVFFVK